jgi:hypothetical protein
VKPEVAQRPYHDPEISSTVGSEQAGDVLNDDPSTGSNKLACDSGELEEQSAALTCESRSSTGNADVLAGEPSNESVESKAIPLPCCEDTSNVLIDRDASPVPRKDAPSVGV